MSRHLQNDPLCKDFIDQAKKTWERIRYSELTRIAINEEAITSLNLLDLQRKHPFRIRTRTFTRHQEAINGTDWEWWLGSGMNWLGLRVQAKKLKPNVRKYRDIDKTHPVHGRQVDNLINHALNSNPPRVPIYVFYNYWDVNLYNPPWLCESYPIDIPMLGCGISHASFVRNVMNQNSEYLADFAQNMYPWSCLVCCTGYSKNRDPLPHRSRDFIRGALEKSVDTRDDYQNDLRFVTDDVPFYVGKVLSGERFTRSEMKEIPVKRVTIVYEGKSHYYDNK